MKTNFIFVIIFEMAAAAAGLAPPRDADDPLAKPERDGDFPSVTNLPTGLLNNGYYVRFFKELQKIGAGAFGSVFQCVHQLEDLCDLGEYAVKKARARWSHLTGSESAI